MVQHDRIVGAAPTTTVNSARDVVEVACKLPNGLILREMTETIEFEQILGAPESRQVKYHRPTGEQVVIEGVGFRIGDTPPILVNGGYRITRNVPKRIWDSWFDANKNSDLVKNKIIYASEKRDDVHAFAREHEKVVTGLEGIDPNAIGKRVPGVSLLDRPRAR